MVYGLSQLAWQARELEGRRDQLARMAALRVARDVHDLLGLGISAELGELSRICATAKTEIRQVTGEGGLMSVDRELQAAGQILASAGGQVRADAACGPLPGAADAVLAPVLREAVANILRHSTARTCTIELTTAASGARLVISNDGVTPERQTGLSAGAGRGRGLANMRARVQAAGGQLSSGQTGQRFSVTAQIPLAVARPAPAVPPTGPGMRREPPAPAPHAPCSPASPASGRPARSPGTG